jgi:hypothetical protein
VSGELSKSFGSIDWTRFGPAINPDDLNAFETRHGLKLPADYRTYLLEVNGGRSLLTELPVPDWPGRAASGFDFLALLPGDNSLDFWVNFYEGELPEGGFLAIANDAGGNFVLLGTEKPHVGEVYYWDSSPDWDLDEETGTMFLVAESFTEFLSKLR